MSIPLQPLECNFDLFIYTFRYQLHYDLMLMGAMKHLNMIFVFSLSAHYVDPMRSVFVWACHNVL